MRSAFGESWCETALGEVIEVYDHIRVPLSTAQRSQRRGDYPYYGASGVIDFVDDYLFDGRYLLVSEDGENLNSRKLPIAFLAEGKFWVNNHAHIIRAVPSIADDYFLMSCLQSHDISGYITGTAQPKLTQANLKSIKVRLPSLPTQRKIAAILSAYDDLIENNARRIALLEALARALYREWFVHFRFPGHEGVALVASALGAIPQGWEVKLLGDIAGINVSSIKRGNEPAKIEYIDIASVSTGRVDKVEAFAFTEAPGRARRRVQHGDIIWSMVRPNRRSYALILHPAPSLIVSTGFAVLTAKQVPYTYLYHAVTTEDFVGYLTNNATGSAYPAVSSEDFRRATVLLPSCRLLAAFHDIAGPLFDQGQNLRQKNANLRRTRDLLLPKLVSGEVDVGDLSIRAGDDDE